MIKKNTMITKFRVVESYPGGGIARRVRVKGKKRRYWHLIKHRFDLTEMIKIQREDYSNTISDKIFDIFL